MHVTSPTSRERRETCKAPAQTPLAHEETSYWCICPSSVLPWPAEGDQALWSSVASGCDDWNARQICVRVRGQAEGNGERKGRDGRRQGGEVAERLKEDERGWKDVKKKQRGGKGGRGEVMKVPCCFLSCFSQRHEECWAHGQKTLYAKWAIALSSHCPSGDWTPQKLNLYDFYLKMNCHYFLPWGWYLPLSFFLLEHHEGKLILYMFLCLTKSHQVYLYL